MSSRKLRAKLMELLRGNAKQIYTRLERDPEHIFRLKRSCIESRGKEDGVMNSKAKFVTKGFPVAQW